MTSLLEEIGGFAGLPWDSPGLLVPENRTTRGFLKMMGLKKNDDLECLKNSYIPFDFLYERYGHSRSYHIFDDEFSITSLGWIHRRVFVFIVCFLGMLVFSNQGDGIHTRLAMVAKTGGGLVSIAHKPSVAAFHNGRWEIQPLPAGASARFTIKTSSI